MLTEANGEAPTDTNDVGITEQVILHNNQKENNLFKYVVSKRVWRLVHL